MNVNSLTGSPPHVMWKSVPQGQRVPDRQVLPIVGTLHVQAFCLWCCGGGGVEGEVKGHWGERGGLGLD